MNRRGAIVVMAAVLMIVLLAMVAFAIDSGYMLNVRTELQRAADAGAMAGAGGLIDGVTAAESEAWRFVQLNRAGARQITRGDVTIEFGQWNKTAKTFTVNPADATAVRVRIQQGNNSVFFGRVLGQQSFTSSAEAIATYKPRDIVMALDYSGSMCFDSQFVSMGRLGRTAVENNMLQMYQELGSPTYGSMQWTPQYISSNNYKTIKKTLGLSSVAYPYPGGSWDDYIDYVRTDSTISSAGYGKKYGYLTWMNYLQEKQCSYADTPDLWKTSEQPITAVKDAVDLFLAYIQDKSPDDQVGLSVYTSSNNTAVLESGLTQDFASIANTVRHRQAGHYVGGTNIYDGLKTARLELQNNARAGAMKLIVLMTDGYANMPYSSYWARKLVLQEAQAAADANIKIIAIALGVDADTDLMEEVAGISGGASFAIPGGSAVSDYEEDLKEVFRQVAADRPLELVQ
jgi:Flp pilus assembly protein TadG